MAQFGGIKNDRAVGTALAIFTIIIWGTTFIASKILLESYTPAEIMCTRSVLAYIVLLILSRKISLRGIKNELLFALLSVFGIVLYFIFENSALLYTTASNCSIIVAAAPIITAILAHIFTKDEKLNRGVIVGFIIAFCGVIMVVFNGTVVLKLNPLGDTFSLLAALMWGIYSVRLKGMLKRYDSMEISRKMMFYAAVITIPIVLIEKHNYDFTLLITPKTALCYLFLGILGSGICFVTWNIAVAKLGVVTASNFIYLNPFTTMLAAFLILREKVTLMGFTGAVLIVLGIYAAERNPKKIL